MTLKFISDITQDKKYYYSLNRNKDFKFWVFFDGPQYLKYLIMYWIKSLVVLDKVTPAVCDVLSVNGHKARNSCCHEGVMASPLRLKRLFHQSLFILGHY